ncbi:hypothetical protein GCM10023204_59800 [Actinomycetospora succinea]
MRVRRRYAPVTQDPHPTDPSATNASARERTHKIAETRRAAPRGAGVVPTGGSLQSARSDR